MKQVRIGLLGCGVVGRGIVETLVRSGVHLASTGAGDMRIVKVAVRDLDRDRGPFVSRNLLCNNWQEVCTHPDVNVVVEVMGGLHPALEAVKTALRLGKHVVTANKELMANYGHELVRLAEEHGVTLLCEASVLGGIPVLHACETYFTANRIRRISGIANGTSNFILSKMCDELVSFGDALLDAQSRGYAESDPSFDVLGYDARFKLKILIRYAFGREVDCEDIDCRGITEITEKHIRIAERLGCKIRHVALAESTGDGIYASVQPTFVPSGHPLYSVNGVNNALSVEADIVGQILFAGPGAGAFATASAVVEDIVKIMLQKAQMPTIQPSATKVSTFEYPGYLVFYEGRNDLRPDFWNAWAQQKGLSISQTIFESEQTKCFLVTGARTIVEEWLGQAFQHNEAAVSLYPLLEPLSAGTLALQFESWDNALQRVAE